MSLNESIIEDAGLECFGELGYAIGHGPHLAPGEPAAERETFSEVDGLLRAVVDDAGGARGNRSTDPFRLRRRLVRAEQDATVAVLIEDG